LVVLLRDVAADEHGSAAAAVASPFVVYELVEGVRAAVAEREP
jgi:hypothetical protein